ncbi:MAG: YfhO family protein [Planctomycetes bacterium]|nr:YfhO family protein [Planctomycetota bacterium]
MSARWGPAAVALVLALAAYAPALHPDRRLAGRDLLVLFEPLHRRVAGTLREGRLPERDPFRGCGTPLVPDPLAQVLYPPALLRTALPFDLGWALWFPLHSALAGAGAAHLARRLGATPRGACLAAAGAALAGPVLSACRTPNLLAGAAWAPWVLAAFVDLARAWHPRAAALGALAVGMTALAGGAPVLVLLSPGVGVLLLALTWRRWRDLPLATTRVGLVTALGAALAGAHLLPFVLFLPETPRAEGISLLDAAQWSMHPLRLLEALVPGVTPQTSDVLRRLIQRSFGPFGAPLHPSVHLALPVVALALAARGRAALGLGLACLLWTGIALGAYTPLFALLRGLPLFGAWRYPEKGILLVAVVLPALAGLGLRALPRVLRLPTFALAAALLLATPLVDGTVLFTLPRAAVDVPPPVARRVLEAETPGRFVRLQPVDADEAALARAADAVERMAVVRRAHIDALQEDLPGRWGIEAFVAYGPIINRRLAPYVRDAVLRGANGEVVDLDLDRLADDACVTHALLRDGRLVRRGVPPRARLVEGRGDTHIAAQDAARLEVEVDLATPGRLYVAEGYFPGWRARLASGEALPVEEARIAFMGVPLPAGQHRVVLEYRTPGLAAGAALSAAALVALALLLRRR